MRCDGTARLTRTLVGYASRVAGISTNGPLDLVKA
jgi:hypothetical protein